MAIARLVKIYSRGNEEELESWMIALGFRSHKLAQVANTQTVERELHALLIEKTREKNSANQIARLWRGSNDGEMKF